MALSTTFYTALCSAMLVYIFSVTVGLEPIQLHIKELKGILDTNKTAALEAKVFTESAYAQFYKDVDKTTPSIIAADEFMKNFGIGFLASIVGAVFFRK